MTYRDDRDALRQRIEALERDLERARADIARLEAEREAASAEREAASAERDWPRSITYEPGRRVWVEWNGTWWRARIVGAVAPNRWHIRYEGWSSDWDEHVGPDRIADGHGPAPGPVRVSLFWDVFTLFVLALVVLALASGIALLMLRLGVVGGGIGP